MRAFLVTARGVGSVEDLPLPTPSDGQAVIDVALVGICGTDVSLFHGGEERLRQARSHYPLRLGHEWTGTVSAVGSGVDQMWLGQRVIGDAMIGCGHCARCLRGRHNICEERYEVGVRGGWPGALAEQLLMPVSNLHRLPPEVDERAGALVEPGGNAYRAVEASGAVNGARVLVLGPGTIGLLCTQFAAAAGAEVHVVGLDEPSLARARAAGATGAWMAERVPSLVWDAVIDATDSPTAPRMAVDLVEPGGRVVCIGIAGSPSTIDSRLLAFKDMTAVGILGGSSGLGPAISAYASGAVDPRPLIGATIGLDDVAEALDGRADSAGSRGPKTLVDPRS